METEKMEMYNGQMWVNARGGCLDSYLCPQRIGDGALLLIHRININDNDIMLNIGRVIAFKFKGKFLIKYLKFADTAINHIIIIKQFIPEREMIIPINQIDGLWAIDEIKNKDYGNNQKQFNPEMERMKSINQIDGLWAIDEIKNKDYGNNQKQFNPEMERMKSINQIDGLWAIDEI